MTSGNVTVVTVAPRQPATQGRKKSATKITEEEKKKKTKTIKIKLNKNIKASTMILLLLLLLSWLVKT